MVGFMGMVKHMVKRAVSKTFFMLTVEGPLVH